jgi:hypothetical protein
VIKSFVHAFKCEQVILSFAYKDIDTWQKVAIGQETGTFILAIPTPLCELLKQKLKPLEMLKQLIACLGHGGHQQHFS